MDPHRFDGLTRRVGSRRGILAAALGGATLLGFGDAVDARKRRRRRRCRRIKYRLRPDTCPTLKKYKCDRKKHVKKHVKCQPGKICLANKSCGLSCAAGCPEDSGCACSTSEPQVCLAAFTTCEDVPTTCATTADCPIYAVCDNTPCGAGGATENRCLPLCGYADFP